MGNNDRSRESDFPSEIWRPFLENRPTIRCSPNFLIYLQGTQAACFYFLKQGKVKSYIQSEDGAEQTLAVFETGSIFGEAAFFDELPRISSAMALTACELVAIDRELVSAQFSKDPLLAMSMIKGLARKVRMLSDRLDHMAFRPARWRVAQYLACLPCRDDWNLCNQEEIADTVGVSRVTVSRILNDFSRKGYVELGYRKIRLIKIKEIEKICFESV